MFLALAETGSLTAAGRALDVRHTTISRRVEQLEHDLGVALITRTPAGVRLTPAGDRVVGSARGVREAMLQLERVAQLEHEVEGVVRVSVSQGLSVFLATHLCGLRAAHPRLEVHLLVSNEQTDLSSGEADLAVRLQATQDKLLTTKKVASLPWGLFASPAYLERRGQPSSIADLIANHELVAYCGSMAHTDGAQWLDEEVGDARIALRVDSIPTALGAATAGVAVAALPCFFARDNPRLVWLLDRLVIGTRETYLVFHPDVGRQRRVRVAIDYICALMRDHAHQLQATPLEPNR